ncbi:WD40 repeat domain-containing protein [Mycobacterium branderi]|uniref:Uncharacterized protein n=1 Tax=Mycobacterium branderi TaxID=43348 RepID=A0AA91LVF3_9MYCO|nr:hypothetical protein [Mycobacterium branderi]MCV7236305.1 hypothetical protein [Mycobacterium branderi]ORA35476.1 hypothetical protein BST20_17975 [Mycobacterium branderi]
MSFTVAQGLTRIANWTKQVSGSRFVGLSSPSFTTDGKYAFAKYSDEQAGRSPYDGGDIHAELVWVEVASAKVHESPIPARSRTPDQQPSRPGAPYALQGSTVVWQGPVTPDTADGPVTVMQLDLSQPTAAPSTWRTIQLPAHSREHRPPPILDRDFTAKVVGAGHGRVAIARKDGADVGVTADRLFLVETDGAVRDLGHLPTTSWANAVFSPDGTHFAYETGKTGESGHCDIHQVTVFDSVTGRPAADFPPGPFNLTPRPYFYGNDKAALWWTPDGKLRATGSADSCPKDQSKPTNDGGVWELKDSQWTQIDPAGTYRDFPMPHGRAAVIAQRELPPNEQKPNERSTVPSLFIRDNGRLVYIANVEPTALAVAPT